MNWLDTSSYGRDGLWTKMSPTCDAFRDFVVKDPHLWYWTRLQKPISSFQPVSCSIRPFHGVSADRRNRRAPPSPRRWGSTADLGPPAAWTVDLLVLPALGAGHSLQLRYWGSALALCSGLPWLDTRHVPPFPRPQLSANFSGGVVSSMLAQGVGSLWFPLPG